MSKKRTNGLEHDQEPLQYLRFDGELHGASIERGLPLDVAERRPWRFFGRSPYNSCSVRSSTSACICGERLVK